MKTITKICLGLLVMLAALQAEFFYTLSGGMATITGYTGPGGALTVPAAIDGHAVTAIGNEAFAGNEFITDVTIPDTIRSIGSGAFYSCHTLTRIELGKSVTQIGDYPFANCTHLREIVVDALNPAYASVEGVLFNKSHSRLMTYPGGKAGDYVVPKSVNTIESRAFAGARGLTTAQIGDNVTTIGFDVFDGCTGLRNVSVGRQASGWEAGGTPFYSCPVLTNVTVSILNANYRSIDGVLFNASRDTLLAYPQGRRGVYLVPGGVKCIRANAFTQCVGLQGVTLPNGLEVIEFGSFAGCSSLAQVTIPDSVTSIYYYAFRNCTGLTHVTLGSGMTYLAAAFGGCKSLTSVFIPEGLTNILDYPFNDCAALTNITIDPRNPAYSSVDGIWLNKNGDTLLHCPPGRIGHYSTPAGVNLIDWGGFGGCSKLTSITLGEGVRVVSGYAFSGCVELTNVVLPDNLTELNEATFYGCNQLASLVMPASLTTIGWYAFSDCASLTSLTIPNSVTNIGQYAFAGCASLTDVTLPERVHRVEAGTFSGCARLTQLTIPDSVTEISSDGFNEIVPDVFSGCTSLTSISIGKGVTQMPTTGGGFVIGPWSAFETCPSLINFAVDPLNTVYASDGGVLFSKSKDILLACPPGKSGELTIPNTVTNVPVAALNNCTHLGSILIGNGSTALSPHHFRGCAGLTNFTVDPLNPSYSSHDGVLFDRESESLVAYPASKTGEYTVPANVQGIADGAFTGSTGLASLTIGPQCYVGGPFTGCTQLTNIVVDPQNRCYSTLDGVLFDKNREVLIAYPPGKSGPYVVPESATTISENAFSGCVSLTRATIGSRTSSLNVPVFQGCSALTNIEVNALNTAYSSHEGVLLDKAQQTLIRFPAGKGGAYALPNSVITFQPGAFADASALVRLTLNVSYLPRDTFSDCTALTSLFFRGDAPGIYIESGSFGTNSLATLYYRAGTFGWGATFDGRPVSLWNPVIQADEATFGISRGEFGFVVTGPRGTEAVVETTTDLARGDWQPVAIVTFTNGTAVFRDSSEPFQGTRFYRMLSR